MQLLCSRTCSPSALLWVRMIELRAFVHAPPRLASPSRRERGECSAAEGHRRRRLRVQRRPAPPEPTGPRHRRRLAGDRPTRRIGRLRRESERSTSNGRAKTFGGVWWWWCAHQLRSTSGRLPRIWGSIYLSIIYLSLPNAFTPYAHTHTVHEPHASLPSQLAQQRGGWIHTRVHMRGICQI
jgi:hypothetical protein